MGVLHKEKHREREAVLFIVVGQLPVILVVVPTAIGYCFIVEDINNWHLSGCCSCNQTSTTSAIAGFAVTWQYVSQDASTA